MRRAMMPSIRSPVCDGSKRLPSSALSRSPAASNSRRRRSSNAVPFHSAIAARPSHCRRAHSAARTSRPKLLSRTVLHPPDASSRSSQVGASLIASSANGVSERRDMVTGRSRRCRWAKPSARARWSLGMNSCRRVGAPDRRPRPAVETMMFTRRSLPPAEDPGATPRESRSAPSVRPPRPRWPPNGSRARRRSRRRPPRLRSRSPS